METPRYIAYICQNQLRFHARLFRVSDVKLTSAKHKYEAKDQKEKTVVHHLYCHDSSFIIFYFPKKTSTGLYVVLSAGKLMMSAVPIIGNTSNPCVVIFCGILRTFDYT
jgi:hypothetical protein